MIGEPGQRVVGMAEHVGAAALPDFDAVDQRAADHVKQIGRGRSRHRLAEHAAGGEEIVRHQGRRAQGLPVDIAVIDDLDVAGMKTSIACAAVSAVNGASSEKGARARAAPRFRIRRRRGRNRLARNATPLG